MHLDIEVISVKGRAVRAPSINVKGVTIVTQGRLIRMARIKDEFWLEGDLVSDPEAIVKELKEGELEADIFTFSQKLPETSTKYDYMVEWDNAAVLQIETFDYWWAHQINDKTRNMARRAQKKGVQVRITEFDTSLVEGISGIYNETPVRQGRPFWHYGKDIDNVRIENATFLERSDFIGAYCGDELIGFVKLVYMGKIAGMMQFLSKIKDRDKAPNNALLAKAVEVCAEKGVRFLTYDKFSYEEKGIDPLSVFKNHNGFKKIDYPRYYVPLDLRGRIALKIGFHHSLKGLLPKSIASYLRKIRTKWYQR